MLYVKPFNEARYTLISVAAQLDKVVLHLLELYRDFLSLIQGSIVSCLDVLEGVVNPNLFHVIFL